MRCRLEARRLSHATRREQRDPLASEEPRRALRSVARLRVLGEKDEERSAELLVEGGEEQRERRVGDPSARREDGGVGGEPLASTELVDEGCERGTVGGQVHGG